MNPVIDIAKARALCEAATPLPWRVGSTETWHIFADCNNNNLMGAGLGRVLLRFNEHYPHGNDAAFIAAARTLLPEALDELEAAHRREAVAAALLERAGAEVAGLRESLRETTLHRDALRDRLGNCAVERDAAVAKLANVRAALAGVDTESYRKACSSYDGGCDGNLLGHDHIESCPMFGVTRTPVKTIILAIESARKAAE